MDHVSNCVYVYLMQDLSLPEPLQAKAKFEQVNSQAGRTVHYHADNGHFADKAFIDACNTTIKPYTLWCWHSSS